MRYSIAPHETQGKHQICRLSGSNISPRFNITRRNGSVQICYEDRNQFERAIAAISPLTRPFSRVFTEYRFRGEEVIAEWNHAQGEGVVYVDSQIDEKTDDVPLKAFKGVKPSDITDMMKDIGVKNQATWIQFIGVKPKNVGHYMVVVKKGEGFYLIGVRLEKEQGMKGLDVHSFDMEGHGDFSTEYEAIAAAEAIGKKTLNEVIALCEAKKQWAKPAA